MATRRRRAASPEPAVFESLAFQVEPPRGRTAAATARAALAASFPGERWRLEALDERAGEFEAVRVRRRGRAVRPAPPLPPAEAWDRAYLLRARPEVAYAEPLFALLDEQQHGPEAPGRGRRARAAAERDDPRTDGNYEWSLEKARVKDAWALFGTTAPGAGVIVGHPDTGFTDHPEIAGSRLLVGRGHDFEEDDPDAHDELSGGPLRNPGHGTSTASVIFSGAGRPAGAAGPEFVSGVAPGAALVPIRTTKSVVLWSMRRLVRAVRFAIDHGCHVVSISLGGPAPSIALRNAVADAERAGLIVLCAAGNQVRFVVFPAAFDEVIAVAASTVGDEEWPGSCRGPAVDVTAPGASVWRAKTERRGRGFDYSVRRGSGTSYAVAGTAGVAALWLSYHGRAALVARYGRDRLAAVFKQLLQQTCRVPRGWDTGDFGAGIVNAKALLDAALPASAPARGLRGLTRRAVSTDDTGMEVLVHLLTPAPRSGVVRVLSDLLDVDEAGLPRVMQDVGAELAFRVGIDAGLRDRLRRAAERPARTLRGARGARRGPARVAIARQLGGRSASRRLRQALRGGR